MRSTTEKSDNNVRFTKNEKAYSVRMSHNVLSSTCKHVLQKCNSSGCFCCKVFRPCETFVCHVTGKTFVVCWDVNQSPIFIFSLVEIVDFNMLGKLFNIYINI